VKSKRERKQNRERNRKKKDRKRGEIRQADLVPNDEEEGREIPHQAKGNEQGQ